MDNNLKNSVESINEKIEEIQKVCVEPKNTSLIKNKNKFPCPICNITFPRKFNMKRHADIKHHTKLIKCTYCKLIFTDLSEHLLSCNKKFKEINKNDNNKSKQFLSKKIKRNVNSNKKINNNINYNNNKLLIEKIVDKVIKKIEKNSNILFLTKISMEKYQKKKN